VTETIMDAALARSARTAPTTSPRRRSTLERRVRCLRPILAFVLAAAIVPIAGPAGAAGGATSQVIVRAASGETATAERLVAAVGGHLIRKLPIVGGFSASVPERAVALLSGAAGVLSVTPDTSLRPLTSSYTAAGDMGSMYNVTLATGAQAMWRAGYTGKGVDVALIDSGVVPVDGLKGRFLNGPDLSFESQSASRRRLDTYGHGTHIAGIIAGRAAAAVAGHYAGDTASFLGMAPDSRLVSIKVADAHGATDVSQVIAAIDWVVQHRSDDGLNIRVLNLSYGTNTTQAATLDPLAYAAEVAWRKGIVVVAAAGNRSFSQTGSLTDPAIDPWILAVGSSDMNGTTSLSDDTVSSFSSSSNWGAASGHRLIDLVAPGNHIVSLRDPASQIDLAYGAAGRVGTTRFRGSGTSQAAAVVSGAAALILQQRPVLKPDEVKRLLTLSAMPINAQAGSQGYGELNLRAGINWPSSTVLGFSQATYLRPATGTGSLERSRGSGHLVMDNVTLSGERDIFGHGFNSTAMAAAESRGTSWSGGTWNGNGWTGSGWSGSSWAAVVWAGLSWSSHSWSSHSWSTHSWSGVSWSGGGWSDNDWTGDSWSDDIWSSSGWN
jgi:serine protease AprX